MINAKQTMICKMPECDKHEVLNEGYCLSHLDDVRFLAEIRGKLAQAVNLASGEGERE